MFAIRPVLFSSSEQYSIISFLRTLCLWNRNCRISATSACCRITSASRAGELVITCQAVFHQHFILSINEINSMKILCNPCFPWTEDSNLHGCYKPKNATCWRTRQYIPPQCLYLLATTAYHHTTLESSSTLLSEPDNSYFLKLLQFTLWNLQK